MSEGDDVVGLTRAIIYAGSPAVLSTLWSVDDVATGDLMAAFYRNILAGKAKAAALREAQVSFLTRKGSATFTRDVSIAGRSTGPRTIEYAHPYFWAPSSSPAMGGDRGDCTLGTEHPRLRCAADSTGSETKYRSWPKSQASLAAQL